MFRNSSGSGTRKGLKVARWLGSALEDKASSHRSLPGCTDGYIGRHTKEPLIHLSCSVPCPGGDLVPYVVACVPVAVTFVAPPLPRSYYWCGGGAVWLSHPFLEGCWLKTKNTYILFKKLILRQRERFSKTFKWVLIACVANTVGLSFFESLSNCVRVLAYIISEWVILQKIYLLQGSCQCFWWRRAEVEEDDLKKWVRSCSVWASSAWARLLPTTTTSYSSSTSSFPTTTTSSSSSSSCLSNYSSSDGAGAWCRTKYRGIHQGGQPSLLLPHILDQSCHQSIYWTGQNRQSWSATWGSMLSTLCVNYCPLTLSILSCVNVCCSFMVCGWCKSCHTKVCQLFIWELLSKLSVIPDFVAPKVAAWWFKSSPRLRRMTIWQ